MLNDQKFVHDPAYRRQRLTEMRERLQQGKVNAQLREQVLQRVEKSFPGQGLFVRSSSNSEDLPNFSGAGLYTTVPNARGAGTDHRRDQERSGRRFGTLKPMKHASAPASIT